MKIFISILFIVLLVIAIVWYIRHTRKLRLGNLVFVSGAVKSGKTTLAVGLALKEYNSKLRKYKFRQTFRKLFHLKSDEEMPLFYSNIPVVVKYKGREIGYVPLTNELVLRTKRYAFDSVILISESSLFADSTDIKDQTFNENLKVWAKLIAHELHGGLLVFESQSLSDNHFALKRNINSYCYVMGTHKIPFLPVLAVDVRERSYSYDTGIAVEDREIEETTKWFWLSSKVWKCFDCCAYSAITDDLEPVTDLKKVDTLKQSDILCVKGKK